jgi:hypothetical protein
VPPPERSSSIGSTIAAASLDELPAGAPSACNAYRAQIARAMACDKFPAASRDALVQGWNQLVKALKQAPQASSSMGEACQQGAKAMRDALEHLCP